MTKISNPHSNISKIRVIILIIGFIYSLFDSSGGKGTIIDIFINSQTDNVAVPEKRIKETSYELF